MSPPSPGSDGAELTTLRLTILGRTPVTDKSSKEGAGRGEGYGKPKDDEQHTGAFLRKPCFCQQANGRSVFSLHTLCPYTLVLLYPCVKLLASVNLITYGLHLPGGIKASRRDASSEWSKEALQDQLRSEPRSTGHQCSFSLLPHVKAWYFSMNGDPFTPQYISPLSTYTWNGILKKNLHFYFWTVDA